tara:strand:- start:799 stop:1878 length:1080 start_codon:yes stop_codon:yes gene_type:complete
MASISKIKQNAQSDELSMVISDVDVSFVNALRRIILSEVETIGFNTDEYLNSDLKIIENNTPVHNEFILHRFGLVPVNFPNINEFDSSKYRFVLNKENTENKIVNVTSGDFEVYNTDTNEKLETNDFFMPDNLTKEHILLLKLKQNEKIHIEGKASKSSGNKNARFSPVSCALYTYVHDSDKFKKAVADAGLKTSQEINSFKIDAGERFFKTNEEDEPNEFEFKIETLGTISNKEIMKTSLQILAKKLLTFRDNVSTIIVDNGNIDTMKIYESLDTMKAFTIDIENETHTLGNLLQAHLVLNPEVQFVAYMNPHPLIKNIQIKVKVEDMTTLNLIIKKTVEKLIETINNFIKTINTKVK